MLFSGERWILVNDGIDDGTFNSGTDPGSVAHIVLDVLPWVTWGVGPHVRLSFGQRLGLFGKSVPGAIFRAALRKVLPEPVEAWVLGQAGGNKKYRGVFA